MKVGIDISQLAYRNTGVAGYLEHLLVELVKNERHDFVLFFSSFRRPVPPIVFGILQEHKNVCLKTFKFPPALLHLLWNVLHVLPIESLIGPIDIFLTSDWTEPPVRNAKKGTILYDLIIYKYPEETAEKIINVQRKKLKWVKKESDFVLCISNSTKKDAEEILGLSSSKLPVIYPGLTI